MAKGSVAVRAKKKATQRAQEFIATAPVPQEQIRAGASVISGLSRRWTFLSPNSRLLGRPYYLALTDRHVLFCWLSIWTGRPRQVKYVVPREQVRISQYRPGMQMGRFRCQVPGREKPMTIRFYRMWRPEIEYLLGQIGVTDAAPAPGMVPGPQPGPAPGQAPGTWTPGA
jgi:hypothetical protein